MKRTILVLTLTVVALAMLTAPVLAIGPENALGKNPKVGAVGGNSYYILIQTQDNSHGIIIEWVPEVPINPEQSAILLNKDAGVFQINNAFVVTSPVQVLQIENTWLYLSQNMLYNFYLFVGMPPNIAANIVDYHTEGVYLKRNVIGQ